MPLLLKKSLHGLRKNINQVNQSKNMVEGKQTDTGAKKKKVIEKQNSFTSTTSTDKLIHV